VCASVSRVRALQGTRLGRRPSAITDEQFEALSNVSLRDAARALGVSGSVVHRWRLSRKPPDSAQGFASKRTEIASTSS